MKQKVVFAASVGGLPRGKNKNDVLFHDFNF